MKDAALPLRKMEQKEHLKMGKHVLQLPHETVFRGRFAIPEVENAFPELRDHE